MFKIINTIRAKRLKTKEMGAADMIAALTLTPLVLMLIFAMIDLSLWLNTKAHIEASARDGVRVASNWGGTGNNSKVRLNPTSQTVDSMIKDKIYDSKKKTCTRSLCTKPPVVKCRVGSLSGTKVVASRAGETVRCQITYNYRSIFFGSELLGFGQITEKPMNYVVTGVTETGYKK